MLVDQTSRGSTNDFEFFISSSMVYDTTADISAQDAGMSAVPYLVIDKSYPAPKPFLSDEPADE